VRKVAFLIAASPTRSFYSQVAVLSVALRKLAWSRWRPSVHLYVGGRQDMDAYAEWQSHLRDVEISWVSDTRFSRDGDWAQSDDVFRFAPRDADVLVAMDADTLPVIALEDLLDCVHESGSIAGVIAHYPFPMLPDTSLRENWDKIARGLIDVRLDFGFSHTLVPPEAPPEQRQTPYYLNFGVVLFSRTSFDEVASHYLARRPALMMRMADPDFSGQAALTLAVAAAGVPTWALPMRYNFPNDARAEEMYPEELADVAIYHYLRTNMFDRHEIFTSAERYTAFLDLPLTGVNDLFREAVRRILGPDYPFVPGFRQTYRP
jgi:hypothetical protein